MDFKPGEIFFQVHDRESSPACETILHQNIDRFSNNCRVLFDAMMRGETLNSVNVVQQFGIIDFRRRRCDLEENGVRMHSQPSTLGKGIKDWYFSETDKEYNKKFLCHE